MEKISRRSFLKASAIVASAVALTACGDNSDSPANNPAGGENSAAGATGIKAGVFYYNFADAYITTVRTALDKELKDAGIAYDNFDAQTNQGQQMDQINTAITNGVNLLIVNIVETSSPDAAKQVVKAAQDAGVPVIFFNRAVEDSIIQSYDRCAFVGTDAPEAGHMQGEMIGDFLVKNFEKTDLNGDGKISYVMFKGQEGNDEAEFRTKFSVEDANEKLVAAGLPKLVFYDEKNADKFLVDPTGAWSAQAATDYMNTILASYTEANKNMVELIIANNDGMAEGAIAALQALGYNTGKEGSITIPVYGVDAMDSALDKIAKNQMTGTVKQDGEAMAATIATLVKNVNEGADLLANTEKYNFKKGVNKINVPYAKMS